MADVERMSGEKCSYHTSGFCLYEEYLNPGFEACWRCRVLANWESAFDEFLARAEKFGVTQDVAPELWARQFERLAREAFACERYEYGQTTEMPGCRHILDGICRILLPSCEGRCRHFKIYQPEDC